ncbi:GntR family transcriptional regulator [Cumulibacter manganitolerans]|uniref:GntR family transcriptional regulator n=1 Tax=Cumulibacter manganitolerans TaxID=1884992 RepID=UPI00225DF426|nr:GntR family transcriptional regulator [Cumulibacter manganitolerans]
MTAKLREMIVAGDVQPGAALRQRDLAASFGVSQTPVREGLRRLESEGLVSNDPHKGSIVAEARAGRWNENFAIRAALESLAAELACDVIRDDQIAHLAAIDDQMRALGKIDDQYRELNKQFHMEICAIAESPLLMSFVKLLWRALGDGPHVVRSHAESARQHRQIIAALRKRDKAKVTAAIRKHILGAPIEQPT